MLWGDPAVSKGYFDPRVLVITDFGGLLLLRDDDSFLWLYLITCCLNPKCKSACTPLWQLFSFSSSCCPAICDICRTLRLVLDKFDRILSRILKPAGTQTLLSSLLSAYLRDFLAAYLNIFCFLFWNSSIFCCIVKLVSSLEGLPGFSLEIA